MKTVISMHARCGMPSLALLLLCLNLAPSLLFAQPSFQNRLLPTPSDMGVSTVDIAGNQYRVLSQLTAASNNNDLLLSSLNTNGSVTGAMRIGSTAHDYPHYMQRTLSPNNVHDGYILVGETRYGSTSAAPRTDLFLIRTDLAGNVLWSRRYGMAASNEYGLCVVQMSDLGFVAVGYSQTPGGIARAYALRTSANGAPMWNRTYDFGTTSRLSYLDIQPTTATASALYLTGTIAPTGGNDDVLLMQINPATGAPIWSNRYFHLSGNTRKETGRCVRVVSGGTQVVVAGTSNSNTFVFKTNLAGGTIWGTRYVSGTETLTPAGIVGYDATANDLLLGGSTRGAATGRRAFYQRLSPAGVTLAFRTYDWNASTIALNDVRRTATGGFLATGFHTPASGGVGNDTYVLRTNAALQTPSNCPPQAPAITGATGVFSAPVYSQGSSLEWFTFQATATPYTQLETLCTGTALAAADERAGENPGELSAPDFEEVRVFPNPAGHGQSVLTLKIQPSENPGVLETPISVRLMDFSGKRLREWTFSANGGAASFELETGALPAGIYVVQVLRGGALVGAARHVRVVD